MKNILFLISIMFFLSSCCNEDLNDNIDDNKDYSVALDTLKNYNDYILGDFNGKSLVSTNISTKGYGASYVSLPIDSSHIQFQIAYKLKEDNIEKSMFVTFRFLESKTKLDSINRYRYQYFSDFFDFFDRRQFVYFQPNIPNQPVYKIHNIHLDYQNYYDVDNDIYGYYTANFIKEITPKDFNFIIDSLKVIENPIKKVEVYYSFKCIALNSYGDKMKMENGKGKSTFEYE